MSNPSNVVQKLLALAADGASENEAANAALRAARLVKEHGLVVSPDSAPSRSVDCVMCRPATTAGQCFRCGAQGLGPGHMCLNPDPTALCEVHKTWFVQKAANPSVRISEPLPWNAGSIFVGRAPPLLDPMGFADVIARELEMARRRIVELEAEIARCGRHGERVEVPEPKALLKKTKAKRRRNKNMSPPRGEA